MKICDALKPVTFEGGDVIVKTGDDADTMYFIEEGEVKVLRTVSSNFLFIITIIFLIMIVFHVQFQQWLNILPQTYM